MTTLDVPPHQPASEFLRILVERGFVHQCTDLASLDARIVEGRIVAYNGFDLTADSLHVGHLIPIMMLRWLQRTGNKPIVLLGGGTTRVGDPSFRDTMRPILSDEEIERNAAGIRRVFERMLVVGDGETDATIVDNATWLDGIGMMTFLRDFGRHFTVGRMLSMDSVRNRMEREQSLTLLEFNYMVLQAVDFVELARAHGCTLQLGASDQWGNIVSGVELGRRTGVPDLFGLTAPLLTTASGTKMGKSAAGAVWLDADKLSPFEFWQFWRNIDDRDVGRFLRLFTELPMAEIARLEDATGAGINEAKKRLADEVVALVHGREAARAARRTAETTFERDGVADDLPSIAVEADRLRAGVPVVDLLVAAGLVSSKGEARRLIGNGGARVNGTPVPDQDATVSLEDVVDGVVRLSSGRKHHVLVRTDANAARSLMATRITEAV